MRFRRKTRADIRLPQSRVGGQEQCRRRSPEHLGRSSRLKKLKNAENVIVAKALDGQRYPLPPCDFKWMCGGKRGSWDLSLKTGI